MSDVLWKEIPDFPDYEASTAGGIRSVQRDVTYALASGSTRTRRFPARVLTPTRGKSNPYLYVMLRRDGKGHRVRVHRLILSTFVGPCPQGMYGLHRNDVPDDNRIKNLYWGTIRQNYRDSVQNGKRTLSETCKHGHPWTEKNTYIREGARVCRQCALERNRRLRGQTPRVGGLYRGKGFSYVA